MNTKTQSGWGTCSKCGGLFYKSFSSADTCKGSGHHTFNNDEHALTQALDANGKATWVNNPQVGNGQEANWAYCKKCHGLFSVPNSAGSVCKDGGKHDSTGSGNYILGRQEGPTSTSGTYSYYQCYNCGVLYSGLVSETKCNIVPEPHSNHAADYHYSLTLSAVTPNIIGTRPHRVVSGETLLSLASAYETTVDKIVADNKLKYPKINGPVGNFPHGYIQKDWDLIV
jgi:hypothetical protein